MPYSDRDYKVSNVNYLNKDFNSLKSTLIEYAKTYFPNSYRDFNETSPGMMLIEMGAYVGDVLSFYIDQQYKEMLLPLAEEKRNVINLANAFGYKVKPILPAYVDLSISQVLGTTGDTNNLQPNYSAAELIPERTQVQSSADSTIIFETLDVVDFKVSGSIVEVNSTDDNGIVSDYKLTKKIRAISAETKTKTFTIGTPEKFLKLTLDETNVVDIISVKDSLDNEYYEVDYLVQDNVPIETHYNDDDARGTAYNVDANTVVDVPVPYTLSFQRTSKKFITEVNDDDTTSLVFGNGILRNGQLTQTNLLQTEQVGLTIPGETQNFAAAIDPLVNNDNRSTLGETPANTTLTVTYRVGGGTSANAAVGDLTTFVTSIANTTVTNETPAYGGSDGQSVDEIREAAKAYFATQNRCVTQEDYEARTLAMPAKFGGIAKVFCGRESTDPQVTIDTADLTTIQNNLDTIELNLNDVVLNLNNLLQDDGGTGNENGGDDGGTGNENGGEETVIENSSLESIIESLSSAITNLQTEANSVGTEITDIPTQIPQATLINTTINLHILSYDENGKLVPATNPANATHPLKTNLKNYLNQFRLLTDEVNIVDGKVINFGVEFEVVAHRGMNKADVKLRVIDKIKNYFTTDKMQFRQPLYTNDVIYEVMGVEGVRSVNKLRLVQEFSDALGSNPLYYFTSNQPTGVEGYDSRYNWKYDFGTFYGIDPNEADDNINAIGSEGVILPSVEPSVFELKFPNKDIRGKVL